MTERIEWTQVRTAIERIAGPVATARPVRDGFNSEIAVIINERYFVKGLRQDHRNVWTQKRERDINPYIRHVSASLEWHSESDGWDLLGFTYLTGRKADYCPGGADLDLIATMISKIPVAPAGVEMKLAEKRWSEYSDHSDLFAGNYLSHTDWSPGNILIADDARIIDWAWPTRGASWIDAACWTIWLTASGHDPAEAESHAAKVPAFAHAPAPAVTAFAAAQAEMWADIGDDAPHPGLSAAALDWHAYRIGL